MVNNMGGEQKLAQQPAEGTVTMTVEDLQKLQATPKKEEPGKVKQYKDKAVEKWQNFWGKLKSGKKAKPPDNLSGIIKGENKNTLSLIKKLTKSLLSKNAKPQDVAEIMVNLSEMRKTVTGTQAQELGLLLLDLRVNKPDAWLEVVSMASDGNTAAQLVIDDMNEVISQTQKNLGSKMTPEDFIGWYSTRPESKIEPDEVMKIVRIVEGGAEKPLEKTSKLFGFDLAKMTPEEKAAMYLELLRTAGVTYDHVLTEGKNALLNMLKTLHNGHSPEFAMIFTDLAKSSLLKGEMTLDDLLLEALKSDDTIIDIRAKYGDEVADEYYKYIQGVKTFDDFLVTKATKNFPPEYSPSNMKKIRKLLSNDYAIYRGMAEGGSEVANSMVKVSDDMSAKYVELIPAYLKKGAFKFAKGAGIGLKWATIGTGLKAISEWKKGTRAGKISAIKWGFGQVGVAAVWLGLLYAFKYGWVKYQGMINDETVKEVKDITGLDLSKKMLKFYTSDEGLGVLRALITEFPQTLEPVDVDYKVPENQMLKMLYLQKGKNGKITKKKGKVEYYFNELYLLESLEDFVDVVKADWKKNGKPKDEKASKKLVAKLLGGEIKKKYIKNGYLIPKHYYLIRAFCDDLDMSPDDEAVQYLEKNPEKFYKFWKGINDGSIPRSTAALYADELAGVAEYSEKDLVVPKEPIAADSLLDVFDQYASLNQKYLPYFNKILKDGYNKYSKNMNNLNAFILGEGEIVYGSITKLSWTVASAKNAEELKEIAKDARNVENGKKYWIGDKYLASLNPKFISNLELVQFVMENTSAPGIKGKQTGLLAWMKKNEKKIHNPYALVKYLYAHKEIFALKGANYGKIEKTLEASVKDFEKMGYMGAPKKKKLLTPRNFMPRGKYKTADAKAKKEGGKVNMGLAGVSDEIIKTNETFMPILEGKIEKLKKNKLYKQALEQGYTEKDILEATKSFFMLNFNLASSSEEKDMIKLLGTWGLALYADTKEPHVISYKSKKPLTKEEADNKFDQKVFKQNSIKLDNAIMKFVLGPLSKKPKEE